MEPITVGLAMESESCRLRKENKELHSKLKEQEKLVESLTAQLLEHEKRTQSLETLASWVHQVVFKHGTRPPHQTSRAEGPYLGQLFLQGTSAQKRYKELKRSGKWREPGSGAPLVIREIDATMRGRGKLEWVDTLYQTVVGQMRRLGPIALADIRRMEKKSGSFSISEIERYVISEGPMVGQYGMRAKRALKAPRILGPYPGTLLTDPEFQQLVPVMDQPKHLLYHMSAGDVEGGFFIDPLEARTNHCTINDLVLINDCRTDPLGPPLRNQHLEKRRLEEEALRQNVATVHVTLDNGWVVVLSVLIKDVAAGGVLWTDYGEQFFTSASPRDAEVYGQLKQCAQALNGHPVPIPLDTSYYLTPLVDLENSQKAVPLSPPTSPSLPETSSTNPNEKSTTKYERKRAATDTNGISVEMNPATQQETAKKNNQTEKTANNPHLQQSKKTKPNSPGSQSPPPLSSANESSPSEMDPISSDFNPFATAARGPMWRRFETNPSLDSDSGHVETYPLSDDEGPNEVGPMDDGNMHPVQEAVSQNPENENPENCFSEQTHGAGNLAAQPQEGRWDQSSSAAPGQPTPMGPPSDAGYWYGPPEMFANPAGGMMMPPPHMMLPNGGMMDPNFQFPFSGFPPFTPDMMYVDHMQMPPAGEDDRGTTDDEPLKKGGSKKKIPKTGKGKGKFTGADIDDGSLSDHVPLARLVAEKTAKTKTKSPASAPPTAGKKKIPRKGVLAYGGGNVSKGKGGRTLYDDGHEVIVLDD